MNKQTTSVNQIPPMRYLREYGRSRQKVTQMQKSSESYCGSLQVRRMCGAALQQKQATVPAPSVQH